MTEPSFISTTRSAGQLLVSEGVQNLPGIEYVVEPAGDRFPPETIAMLTRAYQVGAAAHSTQKRASGEPYFIHCIEVARTLCEFCPEPHAVAAALLHDVLEDTDLTISDLNEQFPFAIGRLVDGVTKLGRVDEASRQLQKAESLRKMFLSMARDIRVIIIKLCDRHHNMRTLGSLSEKRRQRLAKETLDIYAPLANMLGMARMRAELEDLAMFELHPEEYAQLRDLVDQRKSQRDALVEKTIKFIDHQLQARGVEARIKGRSKHFYSIYQKMKKTGRDFEQLYDLLAVRIITGTIKECWDVIAVVHGFFTPIQGRFKDFINHPKPNRYQSIHTTVVGLEGHRVEVQVRTAQMDRIAEEGIAAHWKYKLGSTDQTDLDHQLTWLRRFAETLHELPSDEVENALRTDVLADNVSCFTPGGDIIDLPNGSTPLDFAFRIHTKVGESTQGALVNGQMVQLSYKIQPGDTVEIITSRKARPSRSWLEIAATHRAQNKIRRWLRAQNYDENVERGRDMIIRAVKGPPFRITKDQLDEEMATIIEHTPFNSVEDVYAEVGFGTWKVERILQRFRQQREQRTRQHRERKKRPGVARVVVDGLDGMQTRFARCCQPTPGDDIAGFVTRVQGVTVHRRECTVYKRMTENMDRDIQDRLVGCHWKGEEKKRTRVAIRVIAEDRQGLLADLTQILANLNLFISKSNSQTRDTNTAVLRFSVLAEDLKDVEKFIAQANRIPAVERISRKILT